MIQTACDSFRSPSPDAPTSIEEASHEKPYRDRNSYGVRDLKEALSTFPKLQVLSKQIYYLFIEVIWHLTNRLLWINLLRKEMNCAY